MSLIALRIIRLIRQNAEIYNLMLFFCNILCYLGEFVRNRESRFSFIAAIYEIPCSPIRNAVKNEAGKNDLYRRFIAAAETIKAHCVSSFQHNFSSRCTPYQTSSEDKLSVACSTRSTSDPYKSSLNVTLARSNNIIPHT